jgi:hypothetical protein
LFQLRTSACHRSAERFEVIRVAACVAVEIAAEIAVEIAAEVAAVARALPGPNLDVCSLALHRTSCCCPREGHHGARTSDQHQPRRCLMAHRRTNTPHPAPPAWFSNPDALPQEDVAAAELELRSDNPDDATFAHRWRHYVLLRTGFNTAVRMYRPNFMVDHDDTLVWVMDNCRCLHQFERGRDVTVHSNSRLDTYDSGYMKVCTKCGHEQYVRTHFKNYSGD